MSSSPATYRFRGFELDVAAYELRREGQVILLERQPMDLLILLVERRRQLVSRRDIVDRLWGKGVFVDVEMGINTGIRKIRSALGDSPDTPTFVETVPRRGYRFIAPVELLTELRDAAVATSDSAALPTKTRLEEPRSDVPRVRSPARLLLALTLLALLLVAGVLALRAWRGNQGAISRVTLAVLPFDNLSGDPGREYMADGLAEDISVSLGRIDPDHLGVVARTSTLAYKRTTKSAAAIGREIGADYLVESAIRAEGGRLRVTAKLIRAADQVQVWSESYDREPDSMLGLQQELSAAIAEQIRLRLSPERLDALERRHTRNAEAYDLYLRGHSFANQRTPATTLRAVDYFERATRLDPDYALAWAGLAMTLAASAINSDAPPLEVSPRAREAATRSVRADPNLAEAQHALGYVNWLLQWNWPAAEAAFRRAVTLDPRYAVAHRSLGHALSQMGRHGEASLSMKRARDLDPLYAMTHAMSSHVAFQARDYTAALELARQAIALDPEFWIGHMVLAQAHLEVGDIRAALNASTVATRFSGHNSKPLALRGYAFARAGRPAEALEVLNALEEASLTRYVPPYAMALVNAGLNRRDAAFDGLERAYRGRDVHLIFLTVDPKWDPFRSDPRFEGLLERCGFTRAASTKPPAS